MNVLMNDADLHEYLAPVGASGTNRQVREAEHVRELVGQFGIGFLSGFIVARFVEVHTREVGEKAGRL